MTSTLEGKWVWVWNWRRCDGGDVDRVAARLKAAGCAGALVKAFDGTYWFDQGAAWREIGRALKERGLSAGGWGYLYGRDTAGEAQRAVETVGYGEADLLVLDVESEFKGRPEAAADLGQRIREAAGADYPLYFSSFAIARYHRSFPFESFRQHCTGAAPQVYWNAFRWSLDQSLRWTYEDHAALGIPAESIFPVAGLYREGAVRYPEPEDVRGFVTQAAARGSRGASFWSYEHMDESMWQAVAGATMLGCRTGGEEEEMSSQEFQHVSRSLADLTTRVDRLEADVRGLRTAPPAGGQAAPPAPLPAAQAGSAAARTYMVRKGDTLSGIASRLGLPDWRRLYEANRAVIGADPDLIRPGQVLVIP